ncbi:hypothetical protein D3C85_1112540 [compost metagenome]
MVLFTFSCSNDSYNQANSVDESKYLDQDPDCNQIKTTGTCCDTDGRILVKAGNSYKYTYKANFKLDDIEWTVVSGSIILIEGQGTEATFYFAKDFTKGTISGYGKGAQGFSCQSTVEISKL